MSEHLEFIGRIVDGSKSIFKVQVLNEERGRLTETETIVMCTIGGKLRKNKINIMSGDLVRIKVSPYDTTKGFIVFRI
jgi:translation initiation factor IF-1